MMYIYKLIAKSMKKALTLITLHTLAGISLSSAALTLTINSAAETIALSGSDTGTLAAAGSVGEIHWYKPEFMDTTPTDFIDVSMLYGLSITDSHFEQFYISEAGTVSFSFFFPTAGAASVTVTGTEITASYAGLDAPFKTALSNLSGEMDVYKGDGFSPMIINQTAIPEPSSLVFAGLSLLLVGRRRR
jgi:hypothetical protein